MGKHYFSTLNPTLNPGLSFGLRDLGVQGCGPMGLRVCMAWRLVPDLLPVGV